MDESTAPAASTDTARSATGTSPRMERLKKLLLGVGVGAAILGGAYGVGRLQGAAETTRVREATGRTQAQLSDRATRAEELAARNGRRAALLEGRRQLDVALLAMDERNFGIAQHRLEDARRSLREAQPFEQPPMAAVFARLSSLNIIAAGDFADQRANILRLIQDFDARLSVPSPR